jgi:hypothetical protein
MQRNILQNINHEPSTFKNKNENKNFQPPKIRTFNIQVFKINKQTCNNILVLLLNTKKQKKMQKMWFLKIFSFLINFEFLSNKRKCMKVIDAKGEIC